MLFYFFFIYVICSESTIYIYSKASLALEITPYYKIDSSTFDGEHHVWDGLKRETDRETEWGRTDLDNTAGCYKTGNKTRH